MTSSTMSLRTLLGTLFVLLTVTIIAIAPAFFTEASSSGRQSSDDRTVSWVDHLPNYDIRLDKKAFERIAELRGNRTSSEVADIRDGFTRGEKDLKLRVPSLKIEHNEDIRIPEVIGPDVKQGRAFLTSSSSAKRSDILINFLKQNTELTGVSASQAETLKVAADYTNPDGNLSFVELNQEINGIPVFRGEVKAGFTKNREMIRVVNNLAPGLNYASLSKEFGDPSNAVKAAAGHIKSQPRNFESTPNLKESNELKFIFGSGDYATTAEKMYFPTEPGVAVPAWRVLMWQPVNAFYVIVDAETGTLLWRKNITEDQTQTATYNVYVNPNSMVNIADSPFPRTPGPVTPDSTQAAGISRTLITRVGNEAPYTFNNNGWITDGNNTTDGNNVQAGLDRELPNTGSPANPNDIDPNGVAVGNPNRSFDFPFNPGAPVNPAAAVGDEPIPAGQTTTCQAQGTATAPSDFQKAITTQLFYITNVYHDEMYRLGFTEAARNFQHDNFGRGGNGADRVSAQAQDCSGTSNANFTTPADGTRGTMQMYIFTKALPTPDFDGSLDADVVIHELTHGVSNRLHGNGSGLSLNLSRGMGEGWSDFYAHAMLSEPTDPINGIYTTGGYDTYRLRPVPNEFNNYYYGIRRFPKAVKAFTGPNGMPHNPMTFKDIDDTQDGLGDGAFAPAFTATSPDQVHAAGEVWSTALWEVRALMIQHQGAGDGNRKVLQLVTDGMKLAPLGPTFLTERDAIIAAALAGGTAQDVADLWAGFASRGMGFSASIQNAGTGGGTARVTEAFDLPNLTQTPAFTVSDATGDNDGNFEPGETVSLTIPLSNITGNNATGVTLQVVGGGLGNYGTLNHNSTGSQAIQYTIPAVTPCGSSITLTFNINSSLGPTSVQRTLQIGSPVTTFTENFDGVTAPAFPAGWTVTSSYAPMTFVTTTTTPDTAPNSAFAADLPDCTGAGCPTTNGGSTELTSPSIPITASAATVSFRHRYNSEPGWDGGVLEISIAGGAFQDLITAGGAFLQNGYNGSMGVSSPNPLGGRNGWTGDSGGYITTVARMPATAAGQNVQLRWRFGADNNTAPVGGGWNIDTIQVAGQASCSFTSTDNPRGDFDGDGTTDLAVWRPTEGNWYLNQSTAGFSVVGWGLNGDRIVPGDYDADGHTDTGVFRQSNNTWYGIFSEDHTFHEIGWGLAGDITVQGDYNGDGNWEPAVWRPSEGRWYIFDDTTPTTVDWGLNGDIPVPADYNGDGRTDYAVYRTGTWYIWFFDGTGWVIPWGLAGDIPVPADYDGDSLEDVAVWRPADGTWYIIQSESAGAQRIVPWGLNGDIPVPGDYDGDGDYDLGVYRNGAWFLWQSTDGIESFGWGLAGDRPVPAGYRAQ